LEKGRLKIILKRGLKGGHFESIGVFLGRFWAWNREKTVRGVENPSRNEDRREKLHHCLN